MHVRTYVCTYVRKVCTIRKYIYTTLIALFSFVILSISIYIQYCVFPAKRGE
ncbi:hypothetical protein C2G38_2119269 [Gigaspora rosea]|uniref:Uncharacterized protein n=1 Tax=Gigaspora rosea TaxID=44941 RepID=A0A397U457_9GLOM|nr:hypothetical protein C2G38_2119269 [Gigaspora rosea]